MNRKDSSTFEQYYNYSQKELKEELKTWSRYDMIAWLSWNDPSGIYSDKECKETCISCLTKVEGTEIIMRHIREGYSGRKWKVSVTPKQYKTMAMNMPLLKTNTYKNLVVSKN